jgi:GcrA cell cycle regulator
MEWNDETIARLRAFWSEGLSTAEIGRRMGVSKNAVVGKAHRLNLPPRPSPIRRDGAAASTLPQRSTQPRRVTGPTLPPLLAVPSQVAPLPASSVPAPPRPAPVAVAPSPRPPAPASRPAAVRPAPFRSTRMASCCWPIGEPGTKSFHFCDAEAMTGKPYCTEHAQLAYVKVRDRRDEAAA